jgi:hypothetical protein
MKTSNAFLTEFLTQVNFVLTKEGYAGQLENLLTPVKNLLVQENELLSFSLARYCGANTEIAFFCQWYYQTLKITRDSHILLEENQKFLRQKVPLKFRGVPNLYEIIDQHIFGIFQPYQITLIQRKNQEFIEDLHKKYSYLDKYLSKNYLSKFIHSELLSVQKLYENDLPLSKFVEAQAFRTSFIQIGWPCLLSLAYYFNQEDNPINPAGIKWILVEEVLKAISALHQSSQNKDLQMFIYRQELDETQEFKWLGKTPSNQLKEALGSPTARVKNKEICEKIYQNGKNNLESLIFPDKHKEMLQDLLDWSYRLSS